MYFRLSGMKCLSASLAVVVGLMLIHDDAHAQKRRRECMDCHKEFKEHLDQSYKHDPVKDGCETCHGRHGFAQDLVLTKPMPELCTDCHEGVAGEIAEGGHVHGALTEGGCTSCHDPHAAERPGLMRSAADGSSLCLICHSDLVATFSEEQNHEPFGKNECESCHAPHASSHPALLVDNETKVCESCHEGALDKHDVVGLDDFACSQCHDPHAAAKKRPLSLVAHDPFASGECDACHDIEDGEIDIGDDFPPPDLCSECHDDVAGEVAGSESHFGSDTRAQGGTETCLECHDPHTTGLASMLTRVEGDLCLSCHSELPVLGKHRGPMHKPFVDGKCTDCHRPHGGGGASHLVAQNNDVCTRCHTGMAISETSPPQHAALEEAECLDCHSGHASENAALLTDNIGATCLTCHDKVRHSVTHPPYLTASCDNCHQNHSARPDLLWEEPNPTCGRCHQEQLRLLAAEYEHPPAAEETCLECHSAHGSEFKGLLAEAQGELCSGCHDTEDLLIAAPTDADTGAAPKLHEPVRAGNCSGCHDAHGSTLPTLLTREGENICYGCHTQERVEFAKDLVHRPVAEGRCDACHTPHGGPNESLTTLSAPGLCTQCHDVVEEGLETSHEGFDVSAANCLSCHSPHNSPVANLLKPVVHDPFAEGDCESCHEGPAQAGVIAAASLDACLMCHDDKEEGAGHQHAGGVNCTDCHQPHAARFPALIDRPVSTCTACHDDLLRVAPGQTAHVHRPIAEGSCTECHTMHEPKADGFLAMGQNELCADCHASVRDRATDKTRHAPFGKGECSKCHQTHVSSERYLLARGESELCATCHELDTAGMKRAHRDMPLTGSGCDTCHDPHSTARAASALVLPVLHSPYEDDECDACHGPSGQPPAEAVVCADCHDTDDNFASVHNGGRRGEESGSVEACLDCHSPHAGHETMLVRADQKTTCTQCHDSGEFDRENVHGALDEGCSVCHNVHENNIAALRGADMDEKCISCHENAKEHMHPVGVQYRDPRTGEAMTCIACHEPHSSDFEHLTAFDHNRDLCVQCHAAGTMRVHR